MSVKKELLQNHFMCSNFKLKSRSPHDKKNNDTISDELFANEKIVEGLTAIRSEDGCLNNRMPTLANALYQSDTLSIFDDCYETEKLMTSILSVKVRAHYNAFESIVEHFNKSKNKDISVSVNHKYKVSFKKFVDTTNAFAVLLVTEQTANGEIEHAFTSRSETNVIDFNCFSFPQGTSAGKDGAKAIRRGFDDYLVCSYGRFKEPVVKSFDQTIKLLSILNETASCLDTDFNFDEFKI